jgi:hypothetical protein
MRGEAGVKGQSCILMAGGGGIAEAGGDLKRRERRPATP